MKISKVLWGSGTELLDNNLPLGSLLRVLAAHVKVMEDRIVELEAALGNGEHRTLEPDGEMKIVLGLRTLVGGDQ